MLLRIAKPKREKEQLGPFAFGFYPQTVSIGNKRRGGADGTNRAMADNSRLLQPRYSLRARNTATSPPPSSTSRARVARLPQILAGGFSSGHTFTAENMLGKVEEEETSL